MILYERANRARISESSTRFDFTKTAMIQSSYFVESPLVHSHVARLIQVTVQLLIAELFKSMLLDQTTIDFSRYTPGRIASAPSKTWFLLKSPLLFNDA